MESGAVTVGKKVRRIYKHLVEGIKDVSNSEYEYSPKRANHAIEFVENYCKHSKGKWAGKPIKLELWQKALIESAYGFVNEETGQRKYKKVVFFVI